MTKIEQAAANAWMEDIQHLNWMIDKFGFEEVYNIWCLGFASGGKAGVDALAEGIKKGLQC